LLEIRKQNPEYANLQSPKPLELSEARKLINQDAVLLEYYIGKNKSYCFVITSDDFRIFNLPSEKKLNGDVRQIIDVIQKPDLIWETTGGAYQQYAKVARSLYESLLAPASDQLLGKQRIILAPDGMLNYLPYESLLTSANESTQINFSKLPYLALQYEVEYVPSITVLSAIKSMPKVNEEDRKQLIAFANPARDDSQPGITPEMIPINRGVRDWSQRLEQLPYAAQEVENISKLFPKEKTTLFVGTDASERNVKTMNLSQYEIVHFASHGMIDEQQPQFSSLLLTRDKEEDGYLTMREVFDLKLNADLVVLSACKTGLGQRIRGEGMSGLARSFFAAGASSVLVSLWNIYDRSTSDFIRTFYNQMQTNKLTKSAALKESRKKMIQSQKFNHPYYWAPFILIGN
jgi:CHAT domain-containing protein